MSASHPYDFRSLLPGVQFATASDRYAGWMGQIYSADKDYKITSTPKVVKGTSYTEEKLPVRSVHEYFEHYEALEIDFTFYAPLLDAKGNPSRNFAPLVEYAKSIPAEGRVLLKVPELVTAHRHWVSVDGRRSFEDNPEFLNSELFTERFYKPALSILGDRIAAFIFEKGYQRKDSTPPPETNIRNWNRFFNQAPRDTRYQIEERTDRLKTPEYFAFLREGKLGNVFSHWTWLPDLRRQWDQAGGFSGGLGVMRLLTPLRMTYEETYAKYHPFDRLHDELPQMYRDAAFIIREGVNIGLPMITVVNNRAGGNAPEITRRVAEQLL